MRKTSFRWAVTIKLFKEQGSAGIEQPGPRRASGGAKTVQRTVFRAREMDAQVTCQKHKNMTIIRSIFVLFSLPALRIPHVYHACVILSRSGAGEERKRLLFPRVV